MDHEEDTCSDPQHADAILANHLNNMSVDERNIVLDDIHGVRTIRMEEQTPSMLLKSLKRMQDALDKIEPKAAYDQACSLDSQYVLRDNQFRIMFLRADEFDADMAAQRFVNYLELYHESFGTVALMRPIYFDDLEKGEQALLREGCHQLLPCRDRTGRRIITRIGNMIAPNETECCPRSIRTSLYITQVMATDETTQKFGCVMIIIFGFVDGETEIRKEANFRNIARKFLASCPVRISAVHLCMPNTTAYQLLAATVSLLGPMVTMVRVRKHMGSLTEYKYSLMAYGIPVDQLPITASGRIKTTSHQRWIKYQREREAIIQMGLPPFEDVECPLPMDILIGNAGSNSFQNNPGNTVYRDIMDVYFHRYEAATDKQEKTRITWKVLEELALANCRILVRDRRGWWSIASTDKAREKIAHNFRETRKRLAVQKKRSSVDAPTEAFAEKRIRTTTTMSTNTSTSTSYQPDDGCGCGLG